MFKVQLSKDLILLVCKTCCGLQRAQNLLNTFRMDWNTDLFWNFSYNVLTLVPDLNKAFVAEWANTHSHALKSSKMLPKRVKAKRALIQFYSFLLYFIELKVGIF